VFWLFDFHKYPIGDPRLNSMSKTMTHIIMLFFTNHNNNCKSRKLFLYYWWELIRSYLGRWHLHNILKQIKVHTKLLLNHSVFQWDTGILGYYTCIISYHPRTTLAHFYRPLQRPWPTNRRTTPGNILYGPRHRLVTQMWWCSLGRARAAYILCKNGSRGKYDNCSYIMYKIRMKRAPPKIVVRIYSKK